MRGNQLLHRIFGPFPFARLAHAHALSTGADAFFAVSLAGSIFFNVSIEAARPRIILYLALTMAPFALLAPFVGPLVDRFSQARTGVIAFTILTRGILCLFIAGDLQNLLFYPEAFGVLVLGKAYSVAKSAAVPGLVGSPDDLVAANARLSRLSAAAGALAVPPAAGIMAISDASDVLRVGALVYFAGAALAMRIPPLSDEPTAAPEVERSEVHSPSVILGASVVTMLRIGMGFLTFLVAFGFRRAAEPAWLYGAMLAAVGIGHFGATIASPMLKRHWFREEQFFVVALLLVSVVTFSVAVWFNQPGVLAVGFAVGFGANVGRQAFDSLLQRDAPDATRGRYFARFETRFQLAWVIGALIPVTLSLSSRPGLAILGTGFTIALATTLAGVSIERRLASGLRSVARVRSRSPAADPDSEPGSEPASDAGSGSAADTASDATGDTASDAEPR